MTTKVPSWRLIKSAPITDPKGVPAYYDWLAENTDPATAEDDRSIFVYRYTEIPSYIPALDPIDAEFDCFWDAVEWWNTKCPEAPMELE